MSERNRISGWLVGILGLAVGLRLAAIYAMGLPPVNDALEYHSIAVNLISGHGYAITPDVPTSARPPLYPLLLSAIYTLLGPDYKHALYVQAVMNALLVFPLFWFGKKLSGSAWVGLLSAGMYAMNTSFEIVSRLYSENLLIPLGIGFVISAYYMIQKPTSRSLVLITGVLLGCMGLTKPEYAALGIFFLMVALILPLLRHRWKGVLVVAVISLVFVGAWHIRNKLDVAPPKHTVLVNNKDLLKSYVYPALHGIWWYPVTDMDALETFRDKDRLFFAGLKDPKETRKEAIAVMEAHPLGVASLILSRTLILWFSPPVGTTMLAHISEKLRWVGLGLQYCFVALGLLTLLIMVSKRPEILPMLIFAAYITAVYGLIHAIRRYCYPFIPELTVFSAWGCYTCWMWCRQKLFYRLR